MKDNIAKPKEVVLHLDEVTAFDLEQLLYSLGELVAAGAPIHPPPADVETRLVPCISKSYASLGNRRWPRRYKPPWIMPTLACSSHPKGDGLR